MKDKLIIKINKISISQLIKDLFRLNIDVEIIKEDKKYVICKINNKDLEKIKKHYKIEIINEYTYKNLFKTLKEKLYYLLLILLGILLYIFLSNTIVKVSILSNNKELVKVLTKDFQLSSASFDFLIEK